MRHYPNNSPEAAGRLLALTMVVDGNVDPSELDALDLDTDLEEAVVVVEWGEGLAERLSTGYLAVRIDREAADETRAFAWHWHGG